jgi:hypothetical protein
MKKKYQKKNTIFASPDGQQIRRYPAKITMAIQAQIIRRVRLQLMTSYRWQFRHKSSGGSGYSP